MILENVFLHKQLEIYQRNDPKLKISGTERMFFSLMKGLLYNWKERLFIVKPNTLIKWHRLGFRHFWKIFLKNHSKDIIAIDFLTVPTFNFKLIHILVVIEHHRRRIIHFNVSKIPNPEWNLQQIRNMLFNHNIPEYLI